ncbi:MAG: hypothetical protein JWQ49_4348 [Edaphobacter sp.]|jgi:hypothetical protein|nr:hypothetical protein [Edaphobacter sp.]
MQLSAEDFVHVEIPLDLCGPYDAEAMAATCVDPVNSLR